MLSTLLQSSSTTGLLDQVIEPLKADLSVCHPVPSLLVDPLVLPTRKSFVDISNTEHHLAPAFSITTPSVDDSLFLSRSYPTMHLGRVASVDRHDTDAWAQERKVHDAELHAAVVLPSLGFNGPSSDYFPVHVANTFALMETLAKLPQTKSFDTDRASEGTAVHPHDRTSLTSPACPDVTVCPCPLEDLSEARRRVGELLVRCGVIDCSGASPIGPDAVACYSNSCAPPADDPVVFDVFADGSHLITALANWTSEWLRTVVIQPYVQGNFHFQYQEKPNRAFASVAPRIRRILFTVDNPVQVVIHALWFIGTLTGNGAHDNASFLSVPIFQYLHNNGTFVAEDFMLRTFVACAMIGDKTLNDATLSTNSWNRLTRIPPAILNATEKYTLSCLKWNVVMNRSEWQDVITYLRSCIKMGSAFDPFAYDDSSYSSIVARRLDELIDLCYAGETGPSLQEEALAEVLAAEVLAPQPAQSPEAFDAAEWCPQNDPIVNQKPRTIGIAPGADQNLNSSTFKIGTTAKDMLESILGSNSVPHLAHLAQPAGTSFCGSFGVIGARLAHTIKMAGACQSASWVASHG